jgi:uncharacterized protein YodC (DUF2158 family)
MAEQEIKAGDVVILKSGGPRMTVHSLERNMATCEWFDAKGAAQLKSFLVTSLTKDDGSII